MTMRPEKTVRRRNPLTAIRFLSASATLLALLAEASTGSAALMPQQIVYPRAGVSSEAYRKPSSRVLQRSLVRQAQVSSRTLEPGRLVHADSAQPMKTDIQIVPVQHRTVTPVAARRDNRQEIRAELQRLYAQDGQPMPQIGTPAYQTQSQNGAGPAIVPNSQPPVRQAAPKPASRGLLAGLFDFGRKTRSRTSAYPSGMPTRPPAEPKPFRPPTYRQQLHSANAAQQPKPMPRPRCPTSESRPRHDRTSLPTSSRSARGHKPPVRATFPSQPKGSSQRRLSNYRSSPLRENPRH